jgi:hypothetical protein
MTRHPRSLLRSYTIDGDLARAEQAAVEVTVTLTDELRRWCFFMTPAALAACGDWVDEMHVRLHLGELHMIVVSELSREIIERVLSQLEATGELEKRTLPLNNR